MLRHSARSFWRRAATLKLAEADAAGVAAKRKGQADLEAEWPSIAPNLEFPKLPGHLMQKRPEVPSTIPEKLKLNFYVPHGSVVQGEVESVILPATTGQMGVLPGHVATVAQLKPGLLTVKKDASESSDFFVSSGYAFIHANSVTDIIAIEAVPLDQLDSEAVKKGLAEYEQKVAAAQTDEEKAVAQIGVEVHSAMKTVLGV